MSGNFSNYSAGLFMRSGLAFTIVKSSAVIGCRSLSEREFRMRIINKATFTWCIVSVNRSCHGVMNRERYGTDLHKYIRLISISPVFFRTYTDIHYITAR